MPKITVPKVDHSATGASGASRWMNCPGSVNLIKKLGEDARGSGMDAALGTACHTLAALCLEEKQEPWEYVGYEIEVEDRYKFVVGDEIVASVQVYVDFIWSVIKKFEDDGKKPVLHIERPLKSGKHKDAFGQSDATIEIPGEVLLIVDFKNGMLAVEPDSVQNKYYAALALETHKTPPEKVRGYIAQPRLPHPRGVVRGASFDPGELSSWFDDVVIPAIEETKKPDAHLAVGEWCRFCDARNHCPAIKDEAMYFNLDVEPVYLTDEELDLQLRRYDAISKWGEDFLKAEAHRRILAGAVLTSRKMVEKKSSRIWKDSRTSTVKGEKVVVELDTAAREAFDAAAYENKLKSPAQIEKLPGGKKFTAAWSYKPKTGYTIAPRSDARQEVKSIMDRAEEETEVPA